jgi:hypothetical protein
MEQEDPTAAAGRARGRWGGCAGKAGGGWEEHGGSTKWILYVCSRILVRQFSSDWFVRPSSGHEKWFVIPSSGDEKWFVIPSSGDEMTNDSDENDEILTKLKFVSSSSKIPMSSFWVSSSSHFVS